MITTLTLILWLYQRATIRSIAYSQGLTGLILLIIHGQGIPLFQNSKEIQEHHAEEHENQQDQKSLGSSEVRFHSKEGKMRRTDY